MQSITQYFNESLPAKTLIDDLLSNLKPYIDRLVEYQIKKSEDTLSDFDIEMFRLQLIYDLVKSIDKYALASDILLACEARVSAKSNLEISSTIERDGTQYFLYTQVIYAGGHSIQRLHYRYLTNTNLPQRTKTSSLAQPYKDKIVRLTKSKKLYDEIASNERKIAETEQKIEASSSKTDAEILGELQYRYTTWQDIVSRGVSDRWADQAAFEQYEQEWRADRISFWKRIHIDSQMKYVDSLRSNIRKIQSKLAVLTK